ncbi:MAG: hypothetical protein ACRENP_27260 [Longimicrobiales bacterium]
MQRQNVSKWVLIRDFTLFQLKLFLDGLKGLAVFNLSIIAVAIDLMSKGSQRGKHFYRVLRVAEKFDLWLNLYGPAARARQSGDGLFGASRAGSSTMLGRLEQMARELGFEDPLGADPVKSTQKFAA